MKLTVPSSYFLATAESALVTVLRALPPDERYRTGAFWRLSLSVFGTKVFSTPRPLVAAALGHIPDENYDKYVSFSDEKLLRLHSDYLERGEKALSSFQTADEAAKRYGGAIRFSLPACSFVDSAPGTAVCISSLSGLPAKGDEAHGLVFVRNCTLFKCGARFAEIVTVSNNDIARRALS